MAMATLDWLPAPQARAAMEAAVVRVSTSMSAQEVANTVLAMASLAWQLDGGLHEALELAMLRVSASMSAHTFASTVWAMAMLEWEPRLEGLPEALEAAAERAERALVPVPERRPCRSPRCVAQTSDSAAIPAAARRPLPPPPPARQPQPWRRRASCTLRVTHVR